MMKNLLQSPKPATKPSFLVNFINLILMSGACCLFRLRGRKSNLRPNGPDLDNANAGNCLFSFLAEVVRLDDFCFFLKKYLYLKLKNKW